MDNNNNIKRNQWSRAVRALFTQCSACGGPVECVGKKDEAQGYTTDNGLAFCKRCYYRRKDTPRIAARALHRKNFVGPRKKRPGRKPTGRLVEEGHVLGVRLKFTPHTKEQCVGNKLYTVGDIPMTPRQRDVYVYIRVFWRKYGYAPSYRDIASALNLSSTMNIYRVVVRLREMGLVYKERDMKRDLRPTGISLRRLVDGSQYKSWHIGQNDPKRAARIAVLAGELQAPE